MKKKHIIWISSISAIVCIISICLLCFFCIPRIEYTYDAQNESYIVDKVYGNAKSYTIEAYIDQKPVTKISARAFMNKTKVESIVLSETIEEIERLSFQGKFICI